MDITTRQAMVIRLKKNASKKQVMEMLAKVKTTPKSFDISRFAGTMKWGQDALEFQRELRGND